MPISIIQTGVDCGSDAFEQNARRMKELLQSIHKDEEQIRQGGGAQAIESQHKKKRLTARERISKLIDAGTQFFELGLFAAHEMYGAERRVRESSRVLVIFMAG